MYVHPRRRVAPASHETSEDAPTGNGLRGMSERLSAVGGSLAIAPADSGQPRPGFRLTATVPA